MSGFCSRWNIQWVNQCAMRFLIAGTTISQSKDLDENTVLDLDAEGNVCAMTFEHASRRTDVQQVTLEGIAA